MWYGLRSGSVVVILTVILSGIGFSEEVSSTVQIQDLQKAAQQSLNQGNIPETSMHMQRIINEYPDSAEAHWAQSNLAILNLLTQSDPIQGYTMLSDIMSTHSKAIEAGEILYTGATVLNKQKHYDRAEGLYRYIQQQWAGMDLGLKATVELMKTESDVNNDPNGQNGINLLQQQYGASAKLPETMYALGNYYGQTQNHKKALYAFEQVKKTWPDSSYAAGAGMMMLAIADTASQSDPNCLKEILTLAASAGTDPVCLRALGDATALYSAKTRNEKACKQNPENQPYLRALISLGQLYLKQDFSSSQAAQITFQVAQGYYDLGEYQKAVDCYSSILSCWPTHPQAWYAKYRLGICYQDMGQAGLLDAESIRMKVNQIFNELIREYPNSPAVDAASQWLISQNDSVKGRM